MLEKRQTIRYRLGSITDTVIFCDGSNLVAPILDLSHNGLMTTLAESEARRFRPGQEISGQLRWQDSVVQWQGKVVHCSPARRGIGIGVAFSGRQDNGLESAIRDIVGHPDAGGLHLHRDDGANIVLQVYGRLAFNTSRDAIAYLRQFKISQIDLAHCSTIDSAGLGMLCLAKERGVSIAGAHGSIAKLLAIARIIESEPTGWADQVDFSGLPH